MKRGLYIAILLGALLYDSVSGDVIHLSENEAGVHLDSIGSEVEENELSDGIVEDEDVNKDSISQNKSIVQEIDEEKHSIGEKTGEINEELLVRIDRNSANEYREDDIGNESTNNDVNCEINDSVEVLTEYTEAGINKGENVLPSKEKTRETLNKFSRADKLHEIFSTEEEKSGVQNDLHASPQGEKSDVDSLNSTVFHTVNHYFCKAHKITDNQLILYGTKSWTFPLQDVNLTLSFPSAKAAEPTSSAEAVDFIITGFKVILYIDGVQTRGYITNGGVLQDQISMTFINSGITSLLYKFWLYGTPKHSTNVTELHMMYYLCS